MITRFSLRVVSFNIKSIEGHFISFIYKDNHFDVSFYGRTLRLFNKKDVIYTKHRLETAWKNEHLKLEISPQTET